VDRLTAIIALVVVMAGCQTPGSANPSPLPSASPHPAATSVVLQAADVPAQLPACPSSGPIASYIASLRAADPVLAARFASQWQSLKKSGAREAAISLFAADQSACSAELGAHGTIRSAASLVVSFADEGQADRAWEAGVFGFVPPAPGELPPGVDRGAATGLGTSSWTYDRVPVRLACWRKSVFVALVVFTNLDATSFTAATAAIDARLN
jgi:hypothetical protein